MIIVLTWTHYDNVFQGRPDFLLDTTEVTTLITVAYHCWYYYQYHHHYHCYSISTAVVTNTAVPLLNKCYCKDHDPKIPYYHQQYQEESCLNWLCRRFAALESVVHKLKLPSLVEVTTPHQSSSVSKGKVLGSGKCKQKSNYKKKG